MAIVFELVVNFGRDEAALAAGIDELEREPTLDVRGVPLPLTPPFVTRFRSDDQLAYIEFSIHPRGISYYGGPGPYPPCKARDLNNDELTAVGEQLYERLSRFRGYQAAMVGWDPELLVDLDELEIDKVPDGSISQLDGLVLSNALIERWEPAGFVPFTPGFSWIPYRGTANPPWR